MLVAAPRDLLDQLAVPLLRPPQVRDRRRVAQPRLAGAAVVRRGVAQRPPRLPDLGAPRARPLASSTPSAWSSRAREDRPGVGRRARRRPSASRQEDDGLDWRSRSRTHCAPRSSARFPTVRSPSSWWDGARTPATTRRRPDLHASRSPRGGRRTCCARPASSASAAPTSAASSTVDDIDTRHRAAARLEAAADRRARPRRRLALAALRATASRRAARRRRPSCARRAAATRIARDARSVRHHYDVANEFFALFLDETMTYSCAIFSRGATTLEEAQDAKRELVCTKLALQPGERVLDVGCGWGAFAIHAAKRHGVHVTGITLSPPQAELARASAPRRPGVGDRVEFRVRDWRDARRRAVRRDRLDRDGRARRRRTRSTSTPQRLAALLRPGGRLLNHGIARLRHGEPEAGPFSERYVFPDAAPLHLSRVVSRARARRARDRARRGLPRGLRARR